MRLIDADDLILTILTNDLCGDDNVDKAILNAPTVKAITIEWIEKYIDHRLIKYGDTWTFINGMLADWEKENGSRKGEEE